MIIKGAKMAEIKQGKHVKVYGTREQISKDVSEMTRAQLSKHAKQIFSTVNKRIRRLIDSDTISPALEALKRKRGNNPRFTTGGKDLDALQKEYSEAIAFYNLETGTVTGARSYTNKLKNLIGERIEDKEYINKLFDLLHGATERLPMQIAKNTIGTDTILNQIIEDDVNGTLNVLDSADRDLQISQLIDEVTDNIVNVINNDVDILDNALASIESRLF